jgi:hypothetical protein
MGVRVQISVVRGWRFPGGVAPDIRSLDTFDRHGDDLAAAIERY